MANLKKIIIVLINFIALTDNLSNYLIVAVEIF